MQFSRYNKLYSGELFIMGTKGIEDPLIIFTTGSGIATGVNVFQLSGSVIVQPTPFVSIARENIHYGKRWGASNTITLDGQLTGYNCPTSSNNFLYLTDFQDQLVQKFQGNQFGWFRIRENNSEIFSAPNCQVQSINFKESKLFNMVEYSILLRSYPTDYAESYGVIDPVDTWSFSEDKGKVNLTHEVSAKGHNTFTHGIGKMDAIVNARNFVHSRTGLGFSYAAPIFAINTTTNASPDPILMSRSENQNPLEGTYGITENYKFNRDGLPGAPLITTNCNVQSGIDQDFATVGLSVEVLGGWKEIESGGALTDDGVTKYGNHTPTELTDYVTGILRQSFCDQAKSLSNISDLNCKPISYSVSEDPDTNRIDINVSYDNNQIFGNLSTFVSTDRDILASNDAYFDYAISADRDVIKNVTKYSIAGEIVGRGHLKDRYHNAATFLETKMSPNVTGYLYDLVEDFHSNQDLITRENILPDIESVSIDRNAIEGKITIRGSFSNRGGINDRVANGLPLGEENHAVKDYLEDIVWSWDVTPSLPHYTPTPSNNVGGLYMIYDAGIMKRMKFQLTLECRAKKCVEYQDAIVMAEKYANYLAEFHIDKKSYVDKSASINKNEGTRAIGVTVNGTCKKHSVHNIIDKEKTKIIGDYVN